MRQALVMGARPLLVRNKPFPRIPLGDGNWRIEVENRNASRLRATVYSPIPVNGGEAHIPRILEINGDPVFVLGPAIVSIEIYEAGSEAYVNVIAVRT